MDNCCVVRYTLPPTGQLHLAARALEQGVYSEYEEGPWSQIDKLEEVSAIS